MIGFEPRLGGLISALPWGFLKKEFFPGPEGWGSVK